MSATLWLIFGKVWVSGFHKTATNLPRGIYMVAPNIERPVS
jgi:hypothetical protein